MTDVRYLGSAHWTRTVLTEDGKFKKFENVAPGEVVSVEGDVAERLLQGPLYNRLFVQAGGSEDPQSDDYRATRQIGDGGQYVSQDVAREFGSTVPDGRVIFRTEEDNEEQYPLAGPHDGPQSDNAELVAEDEIQAEAEKAREKARESRSTRRTSGASSDSGSATSSSSSPSPSPGRGERSERPGR